MLGTIKFVDKSVSDNSARRFDHCDVIAWRSGFGVPTGVPHSEVEIQTDFKSFIAAHLGSNTNQHTDWTLGGTCIKSSRSVYAPLLVQSVRLLLFKYRGGDNAHWISKNKMAAMAVQWEQCGTNFRENVANLWVSCYNGNNDLSAWMLFVQHPRQQGEWLRQNPHYALVLTASFAQLPRVLDEQHPRNPVIIPWINCHWTVLPETSFALRVLSLPASVCVSVSPCVNHKFVRAITLHPFKLGPPNLDHKIWTRGAKYLG